jgi:15-cis-phytoene desaturase
MNTKDELQFDVVIVGGGIAGLTAGVALADAGLRCAVVEKQRILGGRARSWTDPKTGDPVHIGPHIMLSEYANFLSLLDSLGTKHKVVWQKAPHFITMVDGQREIGMKLADLPPPMPFLPSVLLDETVGMVDKLSNFKLTAYAMRLSPEDIYRLDQKDALSLLREMGVTEAYIDYFWRFVGMAILNVPLEMCSAGALMRFYRHLVGRRTIQVGFADGGLGDLFAPASRERIERAGGRVLTGADVASFLVGERGARVRGVLLADGTRLVAPKTIAALAPQELAKLVHPAWRAARPFAHLHLFEPCPYVSTYLWFDRKITDRQFWARRFRANDLNCDFYDLSNIHSGWKERPSVIATNAIWSHRAEGMTDEDIVARTRAELEEYLPLARDAKLVHFVVNRIPMAIHCPRPGTESRRPRCETPLDGLLLAGDWTKTEYPSSMESACYSGYVAAERVLLARGISKSMARHREGVEGFTKLFTRAGAFQRILFAQART